MGYIEADLLVSSDERGVDLVAPVPSSKSWQDRTEGAFDHTQFNIDWEACIATCPQGKRSIRYSEGQTRRGTPNVVFTFDSADCQTCPARARCTRAKNGARGLTIYPQAAYEALIAARQRQETDEFKEAYATRAGVEGTISQAVRRFDLRRARYRGLAKTYLQHLATAAAINIVRIADWIGGYRPKTTPVPHIVALAKCLA
jgi:transposase